MDDPSQTLAADPSDWEARSDVARAHYDAGRYAEAYDVLVRAPQIPGDELNVYFAATVFGAHAPAVAARFLDQYLASAPATEAITALRDKFEAAAAERGDALPAPRSEAEGAGDGSEAQEEGGTGPAELSEGAEAPLFSESAEGFAAVDGHPLIVEAGDAVHAAERGPDTNEKVGAILVAAIVHVVLILLFMVWELTSTPPPPPQVTVSSMPVAPVDVETPQLAKAKPVDTSAAPATAMPVLTSESISSFSVAETLDLGDSLSLMSVPAGDGGFGMSITGMGDVSNISAIPAGMRSRCSMSQRMARLRESGGEDRAERAVRNGLDYLTKQQNEDGSFGQRYTAAMTGLVLLAYLGHCQTPESPRFGDSVVRAALFLIERGLENDGLITNGSRGHHEAYEHAIAIYALAELYTMTRESGREIPRLDAVLRRGVGIITDGQTRLGGWPYLRAEKDDMSVSGWNIQALKAAYNTGRRIANVERALDRATTRYLPSIQDSKGAFKYNPDHQEGRASLTAAALLGMQLWKGVDTPEFERGFRFLVNHYSNPSPGDNYYAPYYNTQVFFLAGGKEWEDYNRVFAPRLLDAQNADGSWLGPSAREDNQIYQTCLAVLMLEVYYRYLPTTEKLGR